MYDFFILREVSDVPVPLPVTMMTGVSSMAVSNMLGFSWLTGGAIRYRVYSSFGIDVGSVAKLIATSWIAFFFGLSILLGVLIVAHPIGLSEVAHLPKSIETGIGLLVLLVVGAYFFLGCKNSPLHWVWWFQTATADGQCWYKANLDYDCRFGCNIADALCVDAG
jgi:phosphatidylglycerol lysyltransferase